MPKKSRFRVSVKKQHGKCPQTLFTFEGQPLCHIYWSLGSQLSYKKSLLVIWKISNLVPNTLSADGKFSLLDRDNLTQRIQIQLSQKQKILSDFFSSFLKSSLNFEHFHRKNDTHSWCISEITVCKKHGYINAQKVLFSVDPSKSNMVNAHKHCWNLRDSSFTIVIDHCAGNCFKKSLS